eukprot:scaffold3472_cov136-Isochrysis_galbana.AAC.4
MVGHIVQRAEETSSGRARTGPARAKRRATSVAQTRPCTGTAARPIPAPPPSPLRLTTIRHGQHERVLGERVAKPLAQGAERAVIRERVPRDTRACDAVLPIGLLGDNHANGDAVVLGADDCRIALVRPPLADLASAAVNRLEDIGEPVGQVFGLQLQLAPPQTLHRRGHARLSSGLRNGEGLVGLVNGRLGKHECAQALPRDAPAPLVMGCRAAKLRRRQRDHLANVIRVVLQVGNEQLQLPSMVQRRHGQHVPERAVARTAPVIYQLHLARAMFPERRRDGSNHMRVGPLALRHTRVSADSLVV